MMSVHGAKGPSFPLVVLAEPTATISRKVPSHFVDPERRLWAQALRGVVPLDLLERAAEVHALDREEPALTYVAATRARDVLVVPAAADKRMPDTWTEVLAPALYHRSSKPDRPAWLRGARRSAARRW